MKSSAGRPCCSRQAVICCRTRRLGMSSVCASGSLVRGDVVCCFSHLSISQRLYLPKRDDRLLAGGKGMTYVWPSAATTGSSIKVHWKVKSQNSSGHWSHSARRCDGRSGHCAAQGAGFTGWFRACWLAAGGGRTAHPQIDAAVKKLSFRGCFGRRRRSGCCSRRRCGRWRQTRARTESGCVYVR